MSEPIRIGLVSISDRASAGSYEDQGIPALQDWLAKALRTPWSAHTRLIPDVRATIEHTLVELVEQVGCNLVLTTGGTGPAPRDVAAEITVQPRACSAYIASAPMSRPRRLLGLTTRSTFRG